MGSETATMLNAGLIELDDCILRPVDCGKHIQLVIPALERIVRFVTRFLQGDEGVGEVLYFERKPLHRLSVPASALCASVLQGAVCLMPGLAAVPADEQVGRRAGQAVEHGAVRGAGGAAQVRLRGPWRAALRQAAGPWLSSCAGSRLKPSWSGDGATIQPAAGPPKAPGPRPRPRQRGPAGAVPASGAGGRDRAHAHGQRRRIGREGGRRRPSVNARGQRAAGTRRPAKGRPRRLLHDGKQAPRPQVLGRPAHRISISAPAPAFDNPRPRRWAIATPLPRARERRALTLLPALRNRSWVRARSPRRRSGAGTTHDQARTWRRWTGAVGSGSGARRGASALSATAEVTVVKERAGSRHAQGRSAATPRRPRLSVHRPCLPGPHRRKPTGPCWSPG